MPPKPSPTCNPTAAARQLGESPAQNGDFRSDRCSPQRFVYSFVRLFVCLFRVAAQVVSDAYIPIETDPVLRVLRDKVRSQAAELAGAASMKAARSLPYPEYPKHPTVSEPACTQSTCRPYVLVPMP
jgi:hypothetical protein